MAITILTTPNDLSASKRPIEFTASSNRNNAVPFTGVTAADSGGFAQYTVGSSHGFLAGDVILPTLFSPTLNIIQTVTSVAATTITTDLSWPTPAPSDTTGTVTKNNQDFWMLCNCYRTSDSLLLGQLLAPSINGVFTFDVKDLVDAELTKFLLTYSASPSELYDSTGAYTQYYCRFYEYFNNASGLRTAYDTDVSKDLWAVKSILEHTDTQNMVTNYLMITAPSAKKFLTNMPNAALSVSGNYVKIDSYDNGFLGLSFFCVTNCKVRVKTYTAALVLTDNLLSGTFTSTGKLITHYINPDSYTPGVKYCEVSIEDTSAKLLSEKRIFELVDKRNYRYFITIEFMNQYGSYDKYTFTQEYKVLSENEQKTYDKKLSTGFAVQDRGTVTFDVKENRRFSVKSNLINKEFALWLLELKNTRDAYMWDYTNKVRIPIHDIEMDIPIDYDNDYLIQVTFEASFPKNY